MCELRWKDRRRRCACDKKWEDIKNATRHLIKRARKRKKETTYKIGTTANSYGLLKQIQKNFDKSWNTWINIWTICKRDICTIFIVGPSHSSLIWYLGVDAQIQSPVVQRDQSKIELQLGKNDWQRCTCVPNWLIKLKSRNMIWITAIYTRMNHLCCCTGSIKVMRWTKLWSLWGWLTSQPHKFVCMCVHVSENSHSAFVRDWPDYWKENYTIDLNEGGTTEVKVCVKCVSVRPKKCLTEKLTPALSEPVCHCASCKTGCCDDR